MSKEYEKRFSTAIGEIFKEDKDLMKKLYDCMGKENLSYEREELFMELISMMKEMQEEINNLKEVTQKQQKRQIELEGKNLNILLKEQAKDVVSSAKADYDAAKEAFFDTKEKIVFSVKDTIKKYYQKGKASLLEGASALTEKLRTRNSHKIQEINNRIQARDKKLERLSEIEKELSKTKTQIGNLFRAILGREKRYDKEMSSHLIKFIKEDIYLLNRNDLKQAESFLQANKRMERLKEKIDGYSLHPHKRKASLNDQVRYAKKEQQKNQEMQKQTSYQKSDKGNLRYSGRI